MENEPENTKPIKFRTELKSGGVWRLLRRLRGWLPAETVAPIEFLLGAALAVLNRVLPILFGFHPSLKISVVILILDAILFLDVARRLPKDRTVSRANLLFTSALMLMLLFAGFYSPIRKAANQRQAQRTLPGPPLRLFLELPGDGFSRGTVLFLTNDLFKIDTQKRADEREIRCAVKLPMSSWKTNGGMLRLAVENPSTQLTLSNLDVQLILKASAAYTISSEWKRAYTSGTHVHEYWLRATPQLWPQTSALLPPLYFTRRDQGPFMIVASAHATALAPETIAFFYWFSPDVTAPKIVPLQFTNGRFREVP